MDKNRIIKGYIRLDDLQQTDIKVAKNGKRYLNVVLIPSESKYGDDFMLVTDTPKGEKGNILGNARFLDNDKKEAPRKEDGTANNFKFEL